MLGEPPAGVAARPPRVFLATTALSEFWETEGEILFLGAWCLRHDRKKEWQDLRYEVLPSPWADRERYYAAPRYLDALGERWLGPLTDHLNGAHGVARSPRYWRILVGPWLRQYLHVLYDRYAHLAAAFERDPAARTIVLDPGAFEVPRDTADFSSASLHDPFNLQVFSQLLHGLGHAFPSRPLPEGLRISADLRARRRAPATWAATARRLLGIGSDFVEDALRRVAASRGQIGLCYAQCSKAMLWTLAWRSRFRILRIAVPERPWAGEWSPRFDDRRMDLASMPSKNEFERLAATLLPRHVPLLYLEGYQEAREASRRAHRRDLAVMASAAGWFEHEAFKFIAAEATERGTKLVTMQHGGAYGTSRTVPTQPHEQRVADAFMVWGWADIANDAGRTRNLPSGRLSTFAGGAITRRSRRASAILFVSTSDNLYLPMFGSVPLGPQCEEYLARQLRFLAAVPGRLRPDVRYRGYAIDLGSSFRDRIAERFPDVRFDDTPVVERALAQSRLVVIDYCGTTVLEALAANLPAVLFWDSPLSELRDERDPYFEDLRGAEILFASPEAAAAKVAEVYDDPWAWWGTDDVQGARRRFAARYALSRPDWADCWVKTLGDLAAARSVVPC